MIGINFLKLKIVQNNRLANYMEGRTLFRFDKLNVFPHNSLYKDMKDAFNNIEREEKEDDEN